MFLNVELEFDEPYIKNGCGNCTKCLDSCPTQALNVKNGLDANKCISYQTIENKQDIDVETQKKLSGFAYGCDICNDVCPWNKSRAKSHNPNGLEANKEMLNWTENDWKNLTKEQFDIRFKDSAVQRAGFEKLKKNIQFTLENE